MLDYLKIEDEGKLTLPDEVRERYGFGEDTPIRLIETQSGVLLVPLTDAPMSEPLKAELEEWQSLRIDSLSMFPNEDRSECSEYQL